jgi:hypothetical protein
MSDIARRTDGERLEFLLGVYFRTQAAIEKYMGRQGLPTWTERVAQATADSIASAETDPAKRAHRLVDDLATMLDVYGSQTTMSDDDGRYRLEVDRCGIWDYRERAQQQGVELTLPTPCEFCTDLRRRTAAHLGIPVSIELGDRGCTYVAPAPEGDDGD